MRKISNQGVERKNRAKKVRIVLQLIVIILCVYALYAIIFKGTYHQVEGEKTETDFIAISYFGVQKFQTDSSVMIGQDRLKEHIDALKNMGYETITQDDIIALYNDGEKLPEKSLYLMFEDGRRDTSALAHQILKEYNYIATAMTYAEKFEQIDNKFLSDYDIKKLRQTSFWEFGTNGYRLEYINVFDRYKNYFGHIDSNVYNSVTKYLGRDYNHYLMDYLRDEDRLPTETFEQMQERISGDYENMAYIYQKKLGEIPRFYTLMHSNTGAFGTNDDVSSVNEENIREIFDININREGYALNTLESSTYDLTRLQPQAHWYANHLIMRIVDDTGHEPLFVVGDEKEAKYWEHVYGAAEFDTDKIILTSEPASIGRINYYLDDITDMNVSYNLLGNKAGIQSFILSEDKGLKNTIDVTVEDNKLYIRTTDNGKTMERYYVDLYDFDNPIKTSVDEDNKNSLIAYSDATLSNEKSYEKLQNAHAIIDKYENYNPQSVEDGSEEYIETIDLNDRGNRDIEFSISGQTMTILIDGKLLIRNLDLGKEYCISQLTLESSALVSSKYSQRNLYDDVYDAVFKDVIIATNDGKTVEYSYTYNTFQKLWVDIKEVSKVVLTKVMEFF